eukprot:scaffold24105_cov67-Phaeocystis_antarctica.AAC.2
MLTYSGRPAVHEITTCTRVARVSVVARPRSGAARRGTNARRQKQHAVTNEERRAGSPALLVVA